MSKKASGVLLTEVELELMSYLWQLGEGTVREVLDQRGLELGEHAKPMAYTTASTIIRILEQKGVVSARKYGKSHIYSPELQKFEYESKTIEHMVKNVFEDKPSSLVKRLIGTSELSDEDIQELKTIVSEL